MREIVKLKTGGQYNDGLLVQERDGTYSIVAIRFAKNGSGEHYISWVFPQDKDRQPKDKPIPMQVRLGSRDDALQLLGKILDAIRSPAKAREESYATAHNDDLPF